MGITEIIHHLSRLALVHHVEPAAVRITVEFLNPESAHAAEVALRMGARGTYMDTNLTDSVCNEREFTIMGFRVVAKRPRFEYLPVCNCPDCRRLRDGR